MRVWYQSSELGTTAACRAMTLGAKTRMVLFVISARWPMDCTLGRDTVQLNRDRRHPAKYFAGFLTRSVLDRECRQMLARGQSPPVHFPNSFQSRISNHHNPLAQPERYVYGWVLFFPQLLQFCVASGKAC